MFPQVGEKHQPVVRRAGVQFQWHSVSEARDERIGLARTEEDQIVVVEVLLGDGGIGLHRKVDRQALAWCRPVSRGFGYMPAETQLIRGGSIGGPIYIKV